MRIWMAVTADKYELPIVVGGSYQELAKLLNVGATTVFKLEQRGTVSKLFYDKAHFKVVAAEDEDVEG